MPDVLDGLIQKNASNYTTGGKLLPSNQSGTGATLAASFTAFTRRAQKKPALVRARARPSPYRPSLCQLVTSMYFLNKHKDKKCDHAKNTNEGNGKGVIFMRSTRCHEASVSRALREQPNVVVPNPPRQV